METPFPHTAPFNRLIPPLRLSDLARSQPTVSYERRSLIQAGESPLDLFFFVDSGLVKIYSPAPDGSCFAVRLVGPGEFFGFIKVTDGAGRTVRAFDAEAFTRCSVVLLTGDQIRRMLLNENVPSLADAIEELNRFWLRIFADFAVFLPMTYKERLRKVFEDLAGRLGVHEKRGVLIVPELSHEDLAELIGCSRPLAKRLVSEMVEEGIIARESKRYIVIKPQN